MPAGPPDAAAALHLVEFVASVGLSVASVELLIIRAALRDDGLLSWRVHRTSHRWLMLLDRLPVVSRLLRYPGILIPVAARVAAPLAIAAFALAGASTLVPVLLISAANACVTLRCPEGNDGADQMASIVLLAAALAEGVGTAYARAAALVFICAQASLAYGTSGLLKAMTGGWYDGSFVVEVLKTGSFGHQPLCRFLEAHPALAVPLGWSVAYGDCAYALACLAPPWPCAVLLGFATAFHLGVARVLGLNTFLWSFLGTFPAIYWVSTSLYQGAASGPF